MGSPAGGAPGSDLCLWGPFPASLSSPFPSSPAPTPLPAPFSTSLPAPGPRLPWGTSDQLLGQCWGHQPCGPSYRSQTATSAASSAQPAYPLGLACGILPASAPGSGSGSLRTKLPEACSSGIAHGLVSAQFLNTRAAPATGLKGPVVGGALISILCWGVSCLTPRQALLVP